MTWTDERVETLKTMWSEGKSASQIAKELGGITRNAVIGKVHRLGLSNRGPGGERAEDLLDLQAEATSEQRPVEIDDEVPLPHPVPPAAERAETTDALRPKPAASAPAPIAEPAATQAPAPPEISPEALASLAEIEKRAKRLTLMQLTGRTCKWPVGDPATDDFWFCGLPSIPGKPYCEAHVAIAFQPMSARRDRRSGSR